MLANYVDLQLIPVINLVIYPLAQSESSTFYQDLIRQRALLLLKPRLAVKILSHKPSCNKLKAVALKKAIIRSFPKQSLKNFRYVVKFRKSKKHIFSKIPYVTASKDKEIIY